MTQYLLSVHSAEGEVSAQPTNEQMQQFHTQIGILEADLKSAGAWVFGGRLHEPDTATVVRMSNGAVLTTDGPFMESKEHLGGFHQIVGYRIGHDGNLTQVTSVAVPVGAAGIAAR